MPFHPPSPDHRPRLRIPLGLNIVLLLAVAVVAAAGVGAVGWWLLGRPPIRPAQEWTTGESFDFVKIVLALVGGAGAVVALVVAYRRQQLGEAAEQREAIKLFAERFTKAADQLGAEKAAVRLAGMYALEDLARGTPAQRQTVVNVLCAYLRMPYAPPVPAAESGEAAARDVEQAENERRQQELQVRLTAQRILGDHLRRGDRAGEFWRDIDLDLTDATLVDFDLGRCRVRAARFDRAVFAGRTGFGESWFAGPAAFGLATFDGVAEFGDAGFAGPAAFVGAKFRDRARFSEVWFGAEAAFDDAEFGGLAGFDGADFTGAAGFRGTRFAEAWFNRARFGGVVSFSGAGFTGPGEFGGALVRLNPPRERTSVRLGGEVIDEDAYPQETEHVFPSTLVVVEPPVGESATPLGREGLWAYLTPAADGPA
ncbi:pentapeptide repeat-containing protein [Amycolatopsis sp. Hca4]|uniref:pentapeptide repeat-containing protein n=1 Tax=Amycolatopsis sp. Hca4 TaxID=2742131 RepID=UPI0015920195|nr:pentapeptide repeat-containing protein [Amycolatopsis sp. Hca4]QKV73074.1 pentapeptide repeat-containing protein [Amycolatopsis sp. Hca4]